MKINEIKSNFLVLFLLHLKPIAIPSDFVDYVKGFDTIETWAVLESLANQQPIMLLLTVGMAK